MIKHGRIYAFAICISGCGGSESQEKVNCDSFTTQGEAQQYYEKNNASQLDRDNDGIACEHLPKNAYIFSKLSLEDFSGSYTLIGEKCTDNNCDANVVSLDILSDDNFEVCFLEGEDFTCNKKLTFKSHFTDFNNGVLQFEEGEIKFDSIENSHVKLIFNDNIYYGNASVNLSYLDKGYYYESGILQKNDGSLHLTSISGRIVSWSKFNGLSVTSD